MEYSILALDLATKTGYAHSNGESGVVEFNTKRGESPGMKWIHFEVWLKDFLNANPTDIIVYEDYGTPRSRAAAHCAYALISAVEKVAADLEIELTHRSIHTIKKWALPEVKGKKRNKAKMTMAAENMYPGIEVIDDNHADALLLLAMVQDEYRTAA